METAVLKGLGIKFADPALEAYREKFAAEQQRKSSIQPQEKLNASRYRNKQAQQVPPANLRDRLRHLSPGDLVLDTERDVGALRSNVYDRVEQQQEGSDHGMQRTAGSVAGKGVGRAADEGISPSGASRATVFDDDNFVRSRRARGEPTSRGRSIAVSVVVPSNQPAQQEQAQRAAAPAAEIPTEQLQVEVVPNPQSLTAAEWIAAHGKREVQPHYTGDTSVEYSVAHIAHDGVVINHGAGNMATYPLPPNTVLHVGQKIIIDKSGAVSISPRRTEVEGGKGRGD